MKKYTIQDLADGKCCVKNDGTLEELNKVLKLAFPDDCESSGAYDFYTRNYKLEWKGEDYIYPLPIQSVKVFLNVDKIKQL